MIKVGYCVAYDWIMLKHSIPRIYDQADVICLAIDKNKQSWTGEKYSWDEYAFQKLIADLDPLKKIRIYEDTFYDPHLSPMENEVAQRNKIAAFLGRGGWHVQLDADEYFINFAAFVNFLKRFSSTRKVNICCPLINLYKQTRNGFLWIKPNNFFQIEYFQLATQFPKYEYGRRNGYFNILTDFPILHQSWARGEQEIWEKLKNWGHAKDFNVEEYFQKWKRADENNFSEYKNFHHLHPATWPRLEFKSGANSVEQLLEFSSEDFHLPITQWDLKKSNSIWLSRIRKILSNNL